jgi:hypothetical protein
MTNFTSRFIITETPNGRGTPASVWDATNEADYVNRVRAANIRSDGAWECQTAADAKSFTEEARACSVELIDEATFKEWELERWDSRVIAKALRFGWLDAPADDEDGDEVDVPEELL